MKRDSFVFYRSFFESVEKLKKNDKLTLYSYICRYALGEEVEELTGVQSAIFDLIKPQIDANTRRYEGGKKGGRPKTKEKPNNNLGVTIVEPNVNENVNVNVNENENVNVNAAAPTDTQPTHDFFPNEPSKQDLAFECSRKGYELSAQSINGFREYNRERGWKGDWKKNLAEWWEHEHPGQKPQPKKLKFNFDQHDDYDDEAVTRRHILNQINSMAAEET